MTNLFSGMATGWARGIHHVQEPGFSPHHTPWISVSGWVSHLVLGETPDVSWLKCPVSQTEGWRC